MNTATPNFVPLQQDKTKTFVCLRQENTNTTTSELCALRARQDHYLFAFMAKQKYEHNHDALFPTFDRPIRIYSGMIQHRVGCIYVSINFVLCVIPPKTGVI
jgi:hypothetical protein